MKTEFRNRAFLPIVLPLAIFGGIALLVAAFALILLYNTHEAALVIATVVAGGILLAISLAASQDELDGRQKAAVYGAGVLPVVAGVVFSLLSVGGAVDETALNINRVPAQQVPEDAIIAAENDQTFCLPPDAGCEPTRDWTVAAQDAETFIFEFDNLQAAIPHNVALFTLPDEGITADDVEPNQGGDELFQGEIFSGVESKVYETDAAIEPGTYFFQCSVHAATMIGVLTVTDGEAEPAA